MQEHKSTGTIAEIFYTFPLHVWGISLPVIWVAIKSYFDHHYLFWVGMYQEVARIFRATVQLIRTKKQAEHFVCKLKLKLKWVLLNNGTLAHSLLAKASPIIGWSV